MDNMTWYELLIKPPFTPAAWVFAPAWIFLYLTIGISLVIFLKTGFSKSKILPLIFFGIQLALNFLWSPVFFGLKNIGAALIIILLMLTSLYLTIFLFYKSSKVSAYLLIPYFLWVCFATYLNIGFYLLN